MAITRWTGGYTGMEVMPEGITSMYYTAINREVPRTYFDSPTPPEYIGYGYHVGVETPPYADHQTLYGYKANSLVVTLHNSTTPLEIQETSPSTGIFRVVSNVSGYLRVSYLPYEPLLYYKKRSVTDFHNSPAISRMVPTMRAHFNEILSAMDNIANKMEAVRRRFSIEGYTGFPVYYNDSIGIEPTTPALAQAIIEIGNHLIYLSNYAVSKYGANIITEDVFTYSNRHITAAIIEQFRSDVNAIELELIDLGVMS